MPKKAKKNQPDFRLYEVLPGVFHAKFSSQVIMAKTLLRFQETYENEHFRNKVFTLEQFKKWHIKKYKKFNYYLKWDGFNFPGECMDRFDIAGMSRLEKAFVAKVRKRATGDCYVIATYTGSCRETYWHELAHAMFSLSKVYREAVTPIAKKVLRKGGLRKALLKEYDKTVLVDEVNAYLAVDYKHLDQIIDGVDMTVYAAEAKQLAEIFNKFKKRIVK